MKKCKFWALLMVVFLLASADAQAQEVIDTDQDVSLTVLFQSSGVGFEHAQFSLYPIAETDGEGRLELLAPFNRYPVDVEDRSEAELAEVAAVLEGYILRDQIAPADSGLTDERGRVSFSGAGGMKPGLYLVMADRYIAGGRVYTIQPTMVQLPVWDAENNRWNYDVTIHAKYDSVPEWPEGSTITRKVLKIWENTDDYAVLPESITIHLLKDGEVFDTVVLNAEKLWRHTWTELDPDAHWTVTEDELADYSVEMTRAGITFVITNRYDPDEPTPTPNPDEPMPTPTPTEPTDGPEITPTPMPTEPTDGPEITPTPMPTEPTDEPDVTPTPKPTPKPTEKPDEPRLPQTGQLWWPVAMLVCAGLLLIVIGLARRRGH